MTHLHAVQASQQAEERLALQQKRVAALSEQVDKLGAQVVSLNAAVRNANAKHTAQKSRSQALQRKLTASQANAQSLQAQLAAAQMESAGNVLAFCAADGPVQGWGAAMAVHFMENLLMFQY